MPSWKMSRYTVVFTNDAGEALLHNSFMGAVACIPAEEFAEIKDLLYQEITEEDLKNETLRQLCANGFYFPCHIEEEKYVFEVLDRENKGSNFELTIIPHWSCNFRCTYCYETHQGGIMDRGTIDGLKNFVHSKASEHRGIDVKWFGGEPLLAKEVIYELSDSFLHSCEKNGVAYRSQMTTNGYLLTPEVFDSLLQRRVTMYQITLDGPAVTHDANRKLAGGGQTFEIIFGNLVEMKKKDATFTVSVRVNFNQDNLSYMDELFYKMSENFSNDPRFSLYFRPIGKLGGPNDDTIEVCEPKYAKLMEMELSEKYLQFGYVDKILRKSLQSHGQVCYAGKEDSVIVGADGTLYKCSVAFGEPRNQVGRIKVSGELDIDYSRWNLWVNNKETDMSKCTSCPVIPLCQGKYCPLYTIRNNTPVCPMTPEIYGRMVQLVAGNHKNLF